MRADLITEVTQKTGLPQDKAEAFVDIVVNYLERKLPAPVAGQVDDALHDRSTGSLKDKLAGALGKKSA